MTQHIIGWIFQFIPLLLFISVIVYGFDPNQLDRPMATYENNSNSSL